MVTKIFNVQLNKELKILSTVQVYWETSFVQKIENIHKPITDAIRVGGDNTQSRMPKFK